MGDLDRLIEGVDPVKIGAAALQHMLDRRGIRPVLECIRDEDPEIWAEICEATGTAALRALSAKEGL